MNEWMTDHIAAYGDYAIAMCIIALLMAAFYEIPAYYIRRWLKRRKG